MPPTLILVRHAQALHNVDNNIADPELSALGREQCLELKANLVPKVLSQEDLPEVGLILVSAMRRTIETALLAFPELIEKGIPIVAHAGWQENSAQPCDIGSSISALKAEFPQVDFSSVDPVYPDKTSPAGAKYAYNKKAIMARGRSVLAELKERPEKAIIVVSHSGFLRVGVTGRWYFNADYRVFDFASEDKDDLSLKEREWTEKGGLGWSFEERVELGYGLPEEDKVVPS